ncbi:MAG: hypothetical protein U1E65_22025 [Myxococcota bacterium]
MTVVVDTNVILIANGQHQDVSALCGAACATTLHGVVQSGRVAIDDGYRILNEYQNKAAPFQGKRPGDAFLKWLLRNVANPARCDQVALREHDIRGFESFPEDARLANFDPPDRKFVAVAAAHSDKPPILQAADSKWLDWAAQLNASGVVVEFLCPDDIQAFDDKKKGRKSRKR